PTRFRIADRNQPRRPQRTRGPRIDRLQVEMEEGVGARPGDTAATPAEAGLAHLLLFQEQPEARLAVGGHHGRAALYLRLLETCTAAGGQTGRAGKQPREDESV